MKIAVIDDSKAFLTYITKQLKEIGFINITSFSESEKFYTWLTDNPDTDIVFIDYHLKDIDGFEILKRTEKINPSVYKVMITSDEDPSLKEKALKNGFDSFVTKNISSVDLLALLNPVKKLRNYIKKEIEQKERFKEILKYKETQERFIHQKQNKIMKNELEMFFDSNYLFETYFKPKDLLTGDTIYTKKLKSDAYFLSIIDAMGKGLGASLTAFNALSFLKHSIKKAIEYNDFNFKKLVYDFVDYVKSTLLENEILCVTLISIENETVSYANFGNPPIFISNQIMKANNLPIRIHTKFSNIDSTIFKDKLLITSDGLIEAVFDSTLYYKRLKNFFPSVNFLKDIMNDFDSKCEQKDDMSIIYVTKEQKSFTEIYSKTIIINKSNVDKLLEEILLKEIPQKEKIHLILHEVFTNTLEHAVIKIKNKEKMKKEKKFFKINDTNESFLAKIKILKNDKYVKLEYNDTTKGFDIQTIKDAFYHNYHGRGIKIIKHLSDGLFFNKNGTAIKIFIKVGP